MSECKKRITWQMFTLVRGLRMAVSLDNEIRPEIASYSDGQTLAKEPESI